LEKGVGPRNIIEATFPGGSISGAPKRRALQILRELEPHRRGPYCGAIGYIAADRLLLNVAIRTGVWKEDRLRFWGGGGIVAEHDVEEEQEEIRCKLEPFTQALHVSRSGFWR
jgi:para-aminobenzoate synthetase component 1